jgi:hypothetical protein
MTYDEYHAAVDEFASDITSSVAFELRISLSTDSKLRE